MTQSVRIMTDGELDGVWSVEVDGPAVRGISFPHAAYDFLSPVPIVNVRCKHLLVSGVVMGNVEGVES